MKKETQPNDELIKLGKKQEVYVPQGPFETPSKEFVNGPFYADIAEVMPELAPNPPSTQDSYESSENKAFPLDRRDFLRLAGLGAAVSATACMNRPEERVIPPAKQQNDFTPGVSVPYATTCGACPNACGMLVKTQEGRPIKLEGNPEHGLSLGALCALGQASIQGLYHQDRLEGPQVRYGQRLDQVQWEEALSRLAKKLSGKKKIAILTGGSTGHRHAFFKKFLKKIGSSEKHLYTWEANSLYASISHAHGMAFGKRVLPRVELAKSQFILGIEADFLDLGTAPLFHAKSFARSHGYENGFKGRFVQFEAALSLTGAKADKRFVIPPGNASIAMLLLLKSLYKHAKVKGTSQEKAEVARVLKSKASLLAKAEQAIGVTAEDFDLLAEELLNKPSVIMAGGSQAFDENQTRLQVLAILANRLIGAYNKTLFLDSLFMRPPVQAGDLARFLKEASKLDAVLLIETDPIFTSPKEWQVKEALAKIPTVASIQSFPCEVDHLASFVLPAHHYLEAWGDEEPLDHFWSIRQPVVRPTTDSRQAEDILLWTLAYANKSLPYENYRAYLESQWKIIYQQEKPNVSFERFLHAMQRRGFVGFVKKSSTPPLRPVAKYLRNIKLSQNGLKLLSPLDYRLQDGRGAHLPILQEIGHSLTTVAWDSWLAISPDTAKKYGLKQNQIARLTTSSGVLEGAIFPLPGLHKDVVLSPRGNGLEDKRSQVSYKNGFNPLDLLSKRKDPLTQEPVSSLEPVKLEATNRWYRLATMQKHNDIANRKEIIQKKSLSHMQNHKDEKQDLDTVPDLYPTLESTEYRWGLSVDLDKCTGCGACMTACALENNIPQVGRQQIALGREMHWIRLDRYFEGDIANPQVSFQPVMCQQCSHAPCESVCPVFATTHDPDGFNAMTYNRCVGTRYCANACPYKVRRFNWWTHKWGVKSTVEMDKTPRALNPDVTVRTRGVMEKCTFCVSRLQDAKRTARFRDSPLQDGEVKTACQQTCPSDAINFGNLKDDKHSVTKERQDHRAYLLLGGDPSHGHFGLKTLPNVNYLAEVKHDQDMIKRTDHSEKKEHH